MELNSLKYYIANRQQFAHFWKSQKIKITPSKAKSEPSADDKIDTKVEKDARSKDEMIKEKRKLEAESLL